MMLSIPIPPDVEARLKARAEASGRDLSSYVSDLVSHFADPPTPLEELSGPICQRFLESGMTDEELGELLEKAKHEMRADRGVTLHMNAARTARPQSRRADA